MIRTSRIRGLAAAAIALTAFACGEDSEPECGVGEACPCTTRFDCPDPILEQCSATFGEDGTCQPATDADVSQDVTADVADDAADTTEDAADVGTDAPAEEVGEDVVDGDTVEETSEDVTDAADADVLEDTAADIAEDTAEDTDTADVPVVPVFDRTAYQGWVAYQTFAGLDRVHLLSGNGSQGPFLAPIDVAASVARTPSFSPDGTRVAYVYASEAGTSIRVATLADGTTEDLFQGDYTALRFPEWSPDGTRIVFSAQDAANPDVWNNIVAAVSTGFTTPLSNLDVDDIGERFVSPASWSADGTQLYYIAGVPPDVAGGIPGSSDVWRINADGTEATALTTDANPVSLRVAVRDDGAEILFDTTQPMRMGISALPPADGIALDAMIPVGIAGTDANCDYVGLSNQLVCERLQTPGLANCVQGDSDCDPDICIVDLSSAATILNLTRTPGVRETRPAVTAQPFSELPLAGFEDAP